MPSIPCEVTVDALHFSVDRAYDDVVTVGRDLHGFVDGMHVCWLLRSGGVFLRHGGGELEASPGQWVLLPAWLRRDQRFQPETRILSLRFSCRHDQSGPPFAGDLPLVVPEARMPGLATAGMALVAAVADEQPGPVAACRRQGALLAVAAAWYAGCVALGCREPGTEPIDPRLAAARSVLDAHGRIRPVPYAELTKAAGLSRPQLDRLFPAAYGTSPAAWLDRRALERAMAALVDPQVPIKAIAHRLGFADDAHFARWFRRLTGLAPSQRRGAV